MCFCFRALAEFQGRIAARVETHRHGAAQHDQRTKACDRFMLIHRWVDFRGQAVQRKRDVEDMAKTFEAVLHAVKTDEEQFIGGRKLLHCLTKKVSRLGSPPRTSNIEVEIDRVPYVKVKLDKRCAAMP